MAISTSMVSSDYAILSTGINSLFYAVAGDEVRVTEIMRRGIGALHCLSGAG